MSNSSSGSAGSLKSKIFRWVNQAVNDSIGRKTTLEEKWSRVLADAKYLEDQYKHRNKFTMAIWHGINMNAWKDGKYYFSRFDQTDMKQGPYNPAKGKRVLFSKVKSLVTHLRVYIHQV
ncbi:MAG: hypothetical protein O7H41_12970 [Planctomycetota bacterium]|nr:hypothetical protein [Planctomycetota bacterium]